MKEGDIALMNMPQPDGSPKVRPVLILKILPKYGDVLVSGISSNLSQEIPALDMPLLTNDSYFS